ncbi:transcriptional activator NhaR [Derxia gummosa]|uniref:Transcriptional activator NhaR n=1 Tax=Derxia gummosa DSM 723 TaxID=1121388 RepID=A0A8B6X556_9BURK|nr:transcriptional activator NhaR [Derxia gummosa]
MAGFNYRHLHYFWVVAKEGGISKAAARLDLAVQTVSAQLRQLEADLGQALFTQEGRGLVLTEAGRIALDHADRIFQIGAQMEEALALAHAGAAGGLRLTVGIADSLPKLVAFRLLQPALDAGLAVRLSCHEGEFEHLLADLALHKFDVVLADRPVAANAALKLYNHALGESGIAWFGTPALAAKYREGFPRSLDGAPVLLPTRHSVLRPRLDQWFESQGLRPRVAGEFEDSALLATFARGGLGLMPAAAIVAADLAAQHGLERVGDSDTVREQFYAIAAERRITHPAVERIRAGAGAALE